MLNAYLKDPSGEIQQIEFTNQRQIRELLKKGYSKLTTQERIAYLEKEKEDTLRHVADANLLDVFFLFPKTSKNDGYGTTQGLLRRECEKHGVFLNKIYTGQKVGLVYNYPYALEAMSCEYKVLFTMFESTKMPADWDKYLKMADEIIVPSKFCQRVLKGQFGVDATVINLGYDREVYKKIERKKSKEFTFLHYDAFKWRKGWDIVLTAFDEEFLADEPAKLILKSVNAESTPPMVAYKNVEKITEALSDDKMMELMARANCFVFPSRGEGFGLTPLEAMATGMPAIVPNAHGIAEYWDWEIMPNLELNTIKANYENENFKGMDLGAMFQPTVRSVRQAMRLIFDKWKDDDIDPDVYAEYAKGWTIQITGKNLAHFLKTSYKKASENRKNKIVFLTEDTRHITGGRYYSWWLATAMQSAGFDVEIYTNRMPVFIDEFKSYPQPTVYIVDKVAEVDVKATAYFGSPVVGNMRAIELGEKYGRKSYCEIFDPFPMMAKYKGQHKYRDWDDLLPELKKDHVEIISLCNETNKFIYPWLNKKKSKVHTIYPCINSKERDKSMDILPNEKENWAVFVSRLDFHKNLPHVLEAIKDTDLELHVISSIDGINFEDMVKDYGMDKRVVMHWFASDKEKFEIIKKSKVMINGATFEGFGMWLAEALACGVPCVCYDYPTFKEIAGENNELVFYAQWNNPHDLKSQLEFAVEIANTKANKPNWKRTDRFDFEAMIGRFDEIMNQEPKIGVVTICLNEENFIYPSITSLLDHPNIAKIAVVEGLVEQNEHTPNKNFLSADDTKLRVLDAMAKDEKGKIIYDQYGYAGNKSELRNRGLDLVGSDMDYILVVDGDEVWKHEDLDKLVAYIKKNPETALVWFKLLHFWKNPEKLAVGGQWDAKLFRFFKYSDKTLHWEKHETVVVNNNGDGVNTLGDEETLNDVFCYHYGYMKPTERVQEKLQYYKKRDTQLEVVDTFTEWKDGKPTQPTHGGGTVEHFDGKHPEAVQVTLNNLYNGQKTQ
jgi:glycosyltransferase involved in cell wall biosynthesis